MLNIKTIRKYLAVAAVAVLAAPSAGAAVLDFEGATGGGSETGDTFDVGVFRFTHIDVVASGFTSVTAQADLVETDTKKLLAFNRASYTMERIDLSAFSLDSFDIGGSFISSPNRWADTVRVTATLTDTTTTSIIVDISATDPTYTNTIWNLADVKSVLFEAVGSNGTGPNDYEFSLDNVVYDTLTQVPLPAGLPLMLGAFGLLGLMRRRET